MDTHSSTRTSEIKVCTECNQGATSLRRGMCRACYLRAWRGTMLPDNAACVACDERRHVILRWTRIGDEKIVTCQNCGFLADRLRPRASDIETLRTRLCRERRQMPDRRRNYVIDPEDPNERRTASRRRRRSQALV